jgi:hypothetical protein
MRRTTPTEPESPAPVSPPQLLTAHDLAAVLKMSYWTARTMLLAGTIPRVELPGKNGGAGRRLLCTAEDVAKFVRGCRKEDPREVSRG